MTTFKIGQRVRVIRQNCSLSGKEGTIIRVDKWLPSDGGVRWDDARVGETAYIVNIDGLGAKWPADAEIAFDGYDLAPLVNPDELAWQAFKSQHLTPDPALILAKEVA